MTHRRQGYGGQVALLDYGAGNLTSVWKAFSSLGSDIVIPKTPDDLASARGIVVPGVGHFDRTQRLDDDWRAAIRERLSVGVPLLGICVGMQWLFDGSTEAPGVPGLGVFSGCCARLEAPKVPHIGWNTLATVRPSRLLAGVGGAQVYFAHSFAPPAIDATAAVTDYGPPFSAAVERDNVSAVQFHPEKSGQVGLRILRNWIDAL
jgi:imidazole glycerol-phosphate synthase subunit HisH